MSEIRVNTVVAAEGTSAPNLPYGIQVPVGYGITGAGGINVTGIITAASYDGTVNTGAAATFGGVVRVTKDTESTNSQTGALLVTGGLGVDKNCFVGDTLDSQDLNVGAAATIAGITKITANTSSTSTSTGALVVTGGAGIGGDVWIGAGLSVAGTLTYEDVTNVDSVGLITAKSGVNVSGGQLQVGVAYSVGAAGVCTAAGFVGSLTGAASQITVADESSDTSCNVVYTTAATGDLSPKTGTNLTFNSSTGNLSATQLTGTLQTAAQTNITSLGSLSALTVTGDLTLDNGTNAGLDISWDASADTLNFNDSVYAKFGSSGDMLLFHDGTNSYIRNITGNLYIQSKSGENAIVAVPDGATKIYWDNASRYETTGAGSTSVGISTFQDFSSMGMLRENCNIVANKLSAGTNIDLEDGMIHYYSTNETTTATPNIRYNSSISLNNKMSTGEAVTVTIIYKPNNAGYYAALTVDGSGVTEEWNGGSAPSSANAGGYDVLTHTLVKTADATFLCLSNVQNYA